RTAPRTSSFVIITCLMLTISPYACPPLSFIVRSDRGLCGLSLGVSQRQAPDGDGTVGARSQAGTARIQIRQRVRHANQESAHARPQRVGATRMTGARALSSSFVATRPVVTGLACEDAARAETRSGQQAKITRRIMEGGGAPTAAPPRRSARD